jgi:hypothetical protein
MSYQFPKQLQSLPTIWWFRNQCHGHWESNHAQFILIYVYGVLEVIHVTSTGGIKVLEMIEINSVWLWNCVQA